MIWKNVSWKLRESVEDLDDRLLLVECMDDFYGGCLSGGWS